MSNPAIEQNRSSVSNAWWKRWQWLLTQLLIAGVGLICYANTFSAPFYFDDFSCIVENPVIHDLGNLSKLGNYWQLGIVEDIRNNIVTRFVTYLTFAANYRLHGLEVAGYHLVNTLIHIANALLVYQLVRLLQRAKPVRAAGIDCLALVAALLFVAHPVQTTAVTYIAQRFALLATFFYLGALITYARAASAADRRSRRTFYTVAFITTLLAMFTKEIAFTLPVMIALYDLAFLDGERILRLKRLTPILATLILVPATVMTLAALSGNTGGSVGKALDLATLSGQTVSRWEYFITQWRVIVTYLRLLLLPVSLNFDYDYPIYTTIFHREVFLSGLLVGALSLSGISLLLFNRYRKYYDPALRLVGFGLLWFFLTLSITSSIIRLDDIIFEYRLYLPSVGFITAAVALGDWGLRRLDTSMHLAWGRWVTLLLCVALVGGMGVATILRNHIWSDPLRFWHDTAEKSPNKSRPLTNLANEYAMQGRFQEALPLFVKAKALDPQAWIPPYQIGQIYLVFNQPAAAIDELTQAVRINAENHPTWLALGYAYMQLGMLQDAANAYQQVLTLNPADSTARQELEQLKRQGVYPTSSLD